MRVLPVTALLPATLLRLDARDRAGLEWLKNRARFWITALKRRRKYLPRGEPFGQEEAAALKALIALEEAAGELLEQTKRAYCTENQKEKEVFDGPATFQA